MRIVFMGSGAFGIPCLDALLRSRHHLALVVSQPPSPAGRGRVVQATPVAQWARAQDLACRASADANDSATIGILRDHQPDALVVIAFGQKISPESIQLPPRGAINVHASLLPQWRGAAPINWTILNGDPVAGVSIITLADKMDAGDVLASVSTPVEAQETAGHLHDRLARLSAPVLLDTLEQMEAGTAIYTPQHHAHATFAPKLHKRDGYLDFSLSAAMLARRVRAFSPWPGAGAAYLSAATGKSTRVTLNRVEVVTPIERRDLPPGTFDDDLNVVCGRDALRLIELKPAGSQSMPFRDFVNGRKTLPGDRLVGLAKETPR